MGVTLSCHPLHNMGHIKPIPGIPVSRLRTCLTGASGDPAHYKLLTDQQDSKESVLGRDKAEGKLRTKSLLPEAHRYGERIFTASQTEPDTRHVSSEATLESTGGNIKGP